MKKIVLSVMAVLPPPMGAGVTDRSGRASAADPAADAPGQGRPAGLPGALHVDEPVRLTWAPTATVRHPS